MLRLIVALITIEYSQRKAYKEFEQDGKAGERERKEGKWTNKQLNERMNAKMSFYFFKLIELIWFCTSKTLARKLLQ